ncbi:hypothetical protein HOC32_05615, partial [Candidatus Woesearchaeota archaeon]|nr:hypothetical protein [Candidatus Woesearchaeota archaeon]
IALEREIKINHKDKEYIFSPNEHGLLHKIKIIAVVIKSEEFYSEIIQTPGERISGKITINRDKRLYDELIKEFQELESILAFNGNLKKIFWDTPKDEVICENEDEREKVGLFSSHWQKEYPDPIKQIDEEILTDIIATKEKYSYLTIPKAFWREGNNEFKEFRYINAFFNFYFILEGLYGNGNTKNNLVEKALKESNEFRGFVEFIIESLKKNQRHLNKINEMLKFRNKILSVDNIISLIVSTRGDLHHFMNNPNKVQGTPFNHKEFETIAWVTLGIAVRTILQKIIEINTKN